MQLTLAEKRELVAELKGAIAEELASRASGPADPSRCPRCGSPSLARKGHFMHEAEGRYWKTRRFTHLECGDAMVYWTRRIADMSTVI